MPYAFIGAMSVATTIGIHYWMPSTLLFLDTVLAEYPVFVGSWLILFAAGVDHAVTMTYRKLRFAEVGAKSAAQLHISRD